MPQLLRSLYQLLPRRHRRQGFFLIGLMVVVGLSELGLTATISLLGIALSSPTSLERFTVLHAGAHWVQGMGRIGSPALAMLLLVLLCACVATLVKNIITALLSFAQNKYAHGLAWDLTDRLFGEYLRAPYLWHVQHNSSDLRTHIEWRIYLGALVVGMMSIASQICIVCTLIAATLCVAPFASLFLYITIGIAAAIVYKATQRLARTNGEEITSLHLSSSKILISGLNGIREVQIYRQQRSFARQFHAYGENYTRLMAWRGVFPSVPQWCLESIGLFVLLGVVIIMVWRGESVVSTTGILTLLAGACWRLLPAFNKLLAGSLEYKTNYAAVDTLLNSLQQDWPEAEPKSYNFNDTLALTHISFSYPLTATQALSDINLTIQKGKMVGFVGLSGMGKTTLVNILTGLIVPDQGEILVDNIVTTVRPGYLRIGYVPQQPYILDASLAGNIAFSDKSGHTDMKRVRECCSMAALDFLGNLPQGLDTVLGERGVRLSGGQLQRVSIARALYSNPDILVFDEATSSLDGAAESAIQETILSLKQRLTIILVAHRLSTVQDCDQIFWLHDGCIKRMGTPSEVLPLYAEFLSSRQVGQDNAG